MYKFLTFLFKPLFSLLFPTKIIGKENIIDGKAVVVCNHYSKADIPIVAIRVFPKELHILGKQEAFKNKIAGWFLSMCGGIPLNREVTDMDAIRTVFNLLNQNKKIVLFPEGTRNKSGSEEMLPLKDGCAVFAIKTKSPIIPMLMYRKPKLFRKNYMIIGKPFELTEFYGYRGPDLHKKSNDVVKSHFDELRVEVNKFAKKK